MPKISTMEELFLDEIQDLYDAEKQLTKALPKMAKAASSDALRQAFEEHLEQTRGHVDRLEQVFEALGGTPKGKKCEAMVGLVKEGDDIASNTDETSVRDAGLIAGAQKVEHYEIAGYGSARAHAHRLGHDRIVSLLDMTLDEEKETDEKLTELAEDRINEDAAGIRADQSGISTPKRAASSVKTRSAGSSSTRH
ncbi:MAG TPA: ferritin-like domain-containing protein [Bryobacteraceae bacterium]|nr:ferritin-like domain-containing protein [Bryobacteraceae bacterium]